LTVEIHPPSIVHQIASGLAQSGVQTGDLIMVHSSVKSLGHIEGGLETILLGILEAIGPAGTLLMPALCWTIQPGEVFDPQTTPVIVGALPEFFRTRPGTIRSIHPTHSACGIGKLVHEMLDEHYQDRTPCGAHSPFFKLTQLGGKIVMLGCGLRPNTTMHALEELVVPPYLFGAERAYLIKHKDGSVCEYLYRTHGFKGWEQRYDRVENLSVDGKQANDFLKRGKVLEADTYVLDAGLLRQAVVEKLRQSPFYFVDPLM
jgi:aminoglycoside 3-N-acetyltransferase